jgi:hypothetical protein
MLTAGEVPVSIIRFVPRSPLRSRTTSCCTSGHRKKSIKLSINPAGTQAHARSYWGMTREQY